MIKKSILILWCIILSVPLSVLCYYETDLPASIPYHEGGDCGCACTYSWLNFLYYIDETFTDYTYDYIETYLGPESTDEEIAFSLDQCAKNDKHTVIVWDSDDEYHAWEEIALSIINTKRPHMQIIAYVYEYPYVGHAVLAVAVRTGKDPQYWSDDYDLEKVKWYDSRTVGGFNNNEFYDLGDFYANDYWFVYKNLEHRAVICWSTGSEIAEEKSHNIDLWVKNFIFPSQTADISYSLPEKRKIDLNIYDIMGRIVNNLVNKEQKAGKYTVKWDGKDKSGNIVPNGIYLCNLKAGDFNDSKKIVRLNH